MKKNYKKIIEKILINNDIIYNRTDIIRYCLSQLNKKKKKKISNFIKKQKETNN